MAHRSHDVSKQVRMGLGAGAAVLLFLITWVFTPWWVALIVTAVAAGIFLLSEHINWSAIDWSRLWEW